MKKFYLFAIVVLFTNLSRSQTIFTEANRVYLQNFNALQFSETGTLPDFWKTSVNSTTPRYVDPYSSAGNQTEHRAGNNMSSAASGGVYNYGGGDEASATDRALGGITTNLNGKSINFYHFVKNDGNADIASFSLSYNIEKYRSGTNPAGFSVVLYYSFDGNLWQEAPAAFKTTFGPSVDNAGYANAPSGGSSVANERINISLPVGGVMYFAWNYSASVGVNTDNAIGLALDNVNIVANYPDPLSLQISNFKVNQTNNLVNIGWTAFNDENCAFYEVQKSLNGFTFSLLSEVRSLNTNAAKYNQSDFSPAIGNNYYRLKLTSKAGVVTYSQILKIAYGTSKSEVALIQNPITNRNINLQLTNLEKGIYSLRLINNIGQQYYNRSINYPGGSSTETIYLPGNVSRGVYFVQLTNGVTNFIKQVQVN